MDNIDKKRTINFVYFAIAFIFILIILVLFYVINLKFSSDMIIQYNGYCVSGENISKNLLDSSFEVEDRIEATKVKDYDQVYENFGKYYLDTKREKQINLDYPIFVNDSLALYNLSSKVTLISNDFTENQGYKETIISAGALYNSNSLKRADYYNYIFMKNSYNLFINLKDIKIKTYLNDYVIPMNSIINFTKDYITYYSLENGNFIYYRIMDVDVESLVLIEKADLKTTYEKFLTNLKVISKKVETKQEEEKIDEIDEKKSEEQNKEKTKETTNTNDKEETNQLINKNNETTESLEKDEEKQEKNDVQENETSIENETTEENKNNKSNEVKWIKPTVTCEDFKANTYSCTTNITINDPSQVIYKATTFTFYINGKTAFRISANKTGEIKSTKMLPNTEYTIVGKYQYTNKEGTLLENTFYEGKIKTKDTNNINPINLSISAGNIHPKKIELNDIHIESDIQDEAINGVKTAQIVIDNAKYNISTNLVRNLLNGKSISYESPEVLESNKKHDYEIKIFDTAGNEMKLNGNKGIIYTSKQAPEVNIKVSNQEIIYVDVELNLSNKDSIKLNNYRYVLYTNTGEIKKRDNLKENDKKLTFNNLNLQEIYTLKVFSDFDLEDGKGELKNQEIGNATFATLPISKLGTLKLNIKCDENDISHDSAKLNVAINTDRTDKRLLQILKNVKIIITNTKGDMVEELLFTDVNALQLEQGINRQIDNLNSNTVYYIKAVSIAQNGNNEEEVGTTYTLTNFKTNKKPVNFFIRNQMITKNLIDMDIYIDDIDGAVLDNMVKITMSDSRGKEYVPRIEENIKSIEKIPTNKWIRIIYEQLTEEMEFTLSCTASAYNETNNFNNIKNNYEIENKKFITSGLGGNIYLKGLIRKKEDNRINLIDVKSYNNWYSQVFDTITNKYEANEIQNISFVTDSKYNYDKSYTEDNILRLLSNQCYVYDFSEYVGKTVTISYMARVTENEGKNNSYIQSGMNIGEDIYPITGLNTENWQEFSKTLVIPNDGYLGFYLAKAQKNYYMEIKNLQVELGNQATEYSPYMYKLKANVGLEYIDKNHRTYNQDTKNCSYYIRIYSNNNVNEFEYNYEDTETINKIYEYLIEEDEDQKNYKIELIIKQNGREYILDTITFNYNRDNCTEIKSISTIEEYKKIQPYGNYVLLKNIDLRNSQTESEFTFGSPNISFYGSIDFNGKKISKNTDNKTSYLFYKFEQQARLKNIVIDYYINNQKNRYTVRVDGIDTNIAEEDGIYSLFLYNNANINNVRVNLKQCTAKQKINVALLGYKNSGTIENFIINMENPLYVSKSVGGICLYSDGIIQNGYVYGEGFQTVGDIGVYDSRNIGGLVFQVDGNGILQNIYNLTSIKMEHSNMTYSYGANIAYNVGTPPKDNIIIDSTASVKNVYSIQPIITKFNEFTYYGIVGSENKEETIGPNILNKYSNTTVSGSRYFCEINYDDNSYNTKASAKSLYEPGVQEILLNAEGYNEFIIDELVVNGFYPQLKMNSCMPKQDNIKIDITGDVTIDMLSAKKIENNDTNNINISEKTKHNVERFISNNNIDLSYENNALTEFKIYNPAGITITEINVNYLKAVLIDQTYSKKVSTVYVLLSELEQLHDTDPVSSYLDTYTISSIKGRMGNGVEKQKIYGEDESRTIDIRFVKHVKTAEEWNKINEDDSNGVSGLIQNYRLVQDIDFGTAESSPYITGTFKGFLDGNYQGVMHKISNIQGSEALFKSIDGAIIQNLFIDKIEIHTDNKYIGLIEQTQPQENIKLDNIHITNMDIEYTANGDAPHIGGILRTYRL